MNGSLSNYIKHFGLGLLVTGLCLLLGAGAWGVVVNTVYWWAKEAGEKSKDWAAPRRPRSDWLPWDDRWSKDDRLDLASGLLAGIVGWLIFACGLLGFGG